MPELTARNIAFAALVIATVAAVLAAGGGAGMLVVEAKTLESADVSLSVSAQIHQRDDPLRHLATDRRIFARGALKAALWGQGRSPGAYDMLDVLGLK